MKQKSNSKPLVSVIIPVFNGASYLEEAVNSVQNSAYKSFEVLLIDDGSTDKSRKICIRLEKKYPNVRFYSFKKNRGLVRVLNFALKKARGRYICRINQDDRMYRFRIKTQVAYLRENPDVVAVGSYIKLFDNNGHNQTVKFITRDEDIKKLTNIVSPFADPSVMYRKKIAFKVGGYKQEFWPADDTHLWYRMGNVGKLANIDKVLVEVRYHDKAASVLYFKKLALSTYKMHLWVDEHIQKSPFYIRLYWLTQLVAGLTLTPDLNWSIYRFMKKMINSYASFKGFVNKTLARRKTARAVVPHPRKLNLSGV